MKEITMSRAQQDLESMFGLTTIGTLNNEGGKPRLVRAVKIGTCIKAAAVGQVIGLVLLTVVSLIAFIILCVLRNNLNNKFIELQTEILKVNNEYLSDVDQWNSKSFIENYSPSLITENAKFDGINLTETKPPAYGGEKINCYNLHKLSPEDVVCVIMGHPYTDENGVACNDERMEFLQFIKVEHNCATDTTRIKIFLKNKDSKEIVINSMFGLYFLTEEDEIHKFRNILYRGANKPWKKRY